MSKLALQKHFAQQFRDETAYRKAQEIKQRKNAPQKLTFPPSALSALFLEVKRLLFRLRA